MKAYRIATGARIECFHDPVGEVLIQNVPLAEHQAEAVREARCELVDVPNAAAIRDPAPYVSFPDDLYLSWAMLKAFVAEALKEPGRSGVLAIPRTDQTEAVAATQDVVVDGGQIIYPVRYVVPGAAGEPAPLLVDVRDGSQIRVKWLPHVLPIGEAIHYITPKSIIQIVTPLHLHLANMYAIMGRLAGWARRGVLGKITRTLYWLAAKLGLEERVQALLKRLRQPSDKAPPKLVFYLLRHLNRIGRNCNIHPTAVIEGSVIGDNVRIGAFSYIQFCNIGDNADINDYAHVRFSAIGHDTFLVSREWVSFCVLYPGVFFAPRYIQFAVVGRDAQVYPSMYYDYRLDGKPLLTPFRGKLVDAKMPFMGPTIGHRAKVAGGLNLAAGRVVPNGVIVYPNPNTVVARIPLDLPEGTIIRAGDE